MGCCEPRCPMNYHFMCARNANAEFQDDKKVYCAQHSFRTKKEVCQVLLPSFSICHVHESNFCLALRFLVKRENGGARSEPIKTRSNYMKLTQSAGKRVRTIHDWFWFYF